MKISAGKKVSYNVFFLSMDSSPKFGWPLFGEGNSVFVEEIKAVTSEFFLSLYHRVGKDYEWTDQFLKSEEDVEAFIRHKDVKFFGLYFDECLAGFFVLDFRQPKLCDLSYFGLISDYFGKGLGTYMLRFAILTAWKEGIKEMIVNTNTLDHGRALPLYKKNGFNIIKVEKHTRILSNDRVVTKGVSLTK